MADNNNLIPIPGRLHDVSTDGVGLGADEIFDDAKGKRQSVINQETDAALDNKYDKDETYNKEELNNLITTPNQDYVTVPTYAALPATGEADTVYRVSNYDGEQSQVDATKYSEYAWDGTQYVFLCVKTQIGEVFDITAYNSNTKYADLAAALGTGGANIPEGLRKGGMSVKYVCSSDNKYIQARCISNDFTADTTQWAIADEGVYVENPEFVYVKTDAENKILWAIKIDGSIYYGAGCPQQVKDYIEDKISSLSLDEYEDIVSFLSDFLGSDTTLKVMIDSINAQIETKVDKIEGKSLIDAEYASTKSVIDNPEFFDVVLDAEDKILEGTQADGTKVINLPIDTPSVSIEHVENPEYMSVVTDEDEKILEQYDKGGTKVFKVPVVFKDSVQLKGEVEFPILEQLKEQEKKVRSYFIEHQMYNAPTISGNNTLTIPEGSSVDKDGNAYVGLAASDVVTGEHGDFDKIFAELISFNLINPSINESFKIFEYGKHYPAIYEEEDRINILDSQVIAKIIDYNTVRIICNMVSRRESGGVQSSEKNHIVYRDFNRQTKTVGSDDALTGIGVCTLKIGNNQPVALINNNVREMVQNMGNEEFPWTYGGSDYRNSVYCSNNPAELNGLFYDALSIGSGGHVLCSSPDLINWTYICDIPVGYYCEEVQLVARNNYIFAFTRGRQQDSGYTDQLMPYNPHHMGMALRYNLSTNQWDIKGEDAIILDNSWGDRPTASTKQDKIYAFIGNTTLNAAIDDGHGSPRNGKRLYVFDMNLNILNTMDFGFQRGACNMMMDNLNGNLFVFMASDLRGLFMYPSPADVVNMEGCTEGSFKCLGYNLHGVAPAVLDENGHIISVDSQWQRITYNASYETYQSNKSYFRSLAADGRNGMTFAYIDNRLFDI